MIHSYPEVGFQVLHREGGKPGGIELLSITPRLVFHASKNTTKTDTIALFTLVPFVQKGEAFQVFPKVYAGRIKTPPQSSGKRIPRSRDEFDGFKNRISQKHRPCIYAYLTQRTDVVNPLSGIQIIRLKIAPGLPELSGTPGASREKEGWTTF